MPAVIAVASQTFFNNQIERTYKITEPAIGAKSPREKENKMIKVKQQTMAGPRSPNIKKRRIAAIIENKAKKKNDNRLCHEGYSEINFSFAEKNPARKIMTKNLTISLG